MTNDGPGRRYVAVRLATLDDPARVITLRDSLQSAGWAVHLQSDSLTDRRVWHVDLQPTRHLAYPELVAFALRRDRHDGTIAVVHDSGAVGPSAVTGFTRVRYGTDGAIGRPRWAHSPDQRLLLVVEEATAAGDDSAPGGFVLAAEPAMTFVQMDSVWDVIPAPDWDRIAVRRPRLLDSERDGAIAEELGATMRWVTIDPATGTEASVGAAPRSADIAWVPGPVVDVRTVPDTARHVSLSVPGATVESAGGWIRRNGRIVGPGVALAATREGRFIAALVPRPGADRDEPRVMLGVYIVADHAEEQPAPAQSPG